MRYYYLLFYYFGRTFHAPGSGPLHLYIRCHLFLPTQGHHSSNCTLSLLHIHFHLSTELSCLHTYMILSCLKKKLFLTWLPLKMAPHSPLSLVSKTPWKTCRSLHDGHSGLLAPPDLQALHLLFLCLIHSPPRYLHALLPDVLQVLIT